LGLVGFFSFLVLYTVGRSPWTGDQPVARPPRTHRTTPTQNWHSHSFEPTIPVAEWANRGHAVDREASLSDVKDIYITKLTFIL
jgi:hypothetical protein